MTDDPAAKCPNTAPKTKQTCDILVAKKRDLTFPPCKNFAYLGFFAKVSVPVLSIIPWSLAHCAVLAQTTHGIINFNLSNAY